ncbi:MAG: putative selenate reductase subunit YgfK [Bacteroidetes bacterium GWA2_32_17]|nr:MAG: putative selenate reductase subunit YgfK [Bacteroidetes bacterium GWA2_32_17]
MHNISDKFSTINIERLFRFIDNDFTEKKEIFGIPEELFFKPSVNDNFRIERYGNTLETPIGIAAGPHSQMAQNIISAWLCGARYIELKTIQTLDEINVSKPCIDMQDEGYNCEWSQELKIHESYEEYLKAWIIIHVLRHKFDWNKTNDIGVIFNMSAGYNMEGILKENVQFFFNKMKDCSIEKNKFIELLKPLYPEIIKIKIPDIISDNITLSTMHGCPPDEIEKIGHYLISEKKLHTTIKLNPTMIGAKDLRYILNDKLKFKTEVPDIAFEHDLKFDDAIKLIKSLQETASYNNVQFNIKLTNTLESINFKNIFPESEKMMYMSGRALHPISINLAKKLQNEFKGKLNISFCGGADCFNISDILNCGLQPVTTCSDILKPGGYGRLFQYIENIRNNNVITNKLEYLNKYAEEVVSEKAYICDSFHTPDIKTNRELNYFDCIHPPCVDTCPTNQDIPDYLYLTSIGEFEKAFEVILKKNPFPTSLGMVCDHLCQSKCTRINYDNNIQIREVKRFIADFGNKENFLKPAKDNGLKVSIIGAGPSGLACAYFLRLAGFQINVFETKNIAGGMVTDAIPTFRLKAQSIQKDIERIKNLGVKINYGCKIDSTSFKNIQQESDYIYIATGAQKFKKLGIEGENTKGVIDAFEFLSSVKNGKKIDIGNNVIVIGGGNTAMDVARTAYRMVPINGKVIVVYRRTMHEMPADAEEITALIGEGIEIIELTSPEKIISKNGKVKSIICSKMKLGEPDSSGRAKPIKIENSEFEIIADSIIPALGQNVDINFIKPELLKANSSTFETQIKNVFIGGDAMRGAATIVKAVGDGRKVASQILNRAGINFNFEPEKVNRSLNYKDYIIKKSKRIKGEQLTETELQNRKNFDIVISPLTKEQAVAEAKRCLLCDDVCSVCVTVCPNRANYSYFIEPKSINIYKAIKNSDKINIEKAGVLNLTQKTQILNIGDFCNECGNCTTFCPTNGKPFKDKPKFYLTQKSFNEVENGFILNKLQNNTILLHKTNNEISSLSLKENEFIYKSGNVKATFNKSDFTIKNVEFLNKNINEFEFTEAVQMFALFDVVKNLY